MSGEIYTGKVHNCDEKPIAVTISQKSHGKPWLFHVAYYHSRIFYCPYCGKHLDPTDKEKQRAVEQISITMKFRGMQE